MSILSSIPRHRFAPVAAAALLAAATILAAVPADARLGGGSSFGGRGSRTFSMPAPTNTAPRTAPIERSQTAAPFNNGSSYAGASYAGASRPGFFGGNFGRGLIGGFLGAGLFGLLTGNGLFGGMGGGMGLLGLLLQIGLIVLAFRFLAGLFRRQLAFGGGNGGSFGSGPAYGGPRSVNSGPVPQRGMPIAIEPADYQVFEQRLIASQAAYSDNNVEALRQLATPEMAGNFARELAGNSRQGVANRLSDVRLMSGDLSEAWREDATDYATVAMRFSLIDVTVEQASGRVVAGNPNAQQEVTEVWTFARRSGTGPSGWLLSAVQQA